jgi:uncharacterized protein YecT (DUF1311 family)
MASLYEGGTMAPLARLNCLTSRTSARVADLTTFLEAVSG